jgi:F-type H+-transporting ATPase subunit delta
MKSIAFDNCQTNSYFYSKPTTKVEVEKTEILLTMELQGLFHLLFENKRFEILDAI